MTEEFSPADSAWLRQWLERSSGIVIREDQAYLLNSRLAAIARGAGLSMGELVARLRGGDRILVTACVDALTTNETSWFRDVHPFEVLASTILPERIEATGARRELSVWSAASSAGQELYSVSMLLADRFPELASGWRLNLVGTDLSRKMVAKASSGEYSQMEVDRGLPAKYMVRYMEKQGLSWKVRPELMRPCRFLAHNLVTDPAPGSFDVILCRYVLIYFDDATKMRVVDRLASALKPGGSLILGASEIGGRHMERFSMRTVGRVVVYDAP